MTTQEIIEALYKIKEGIEFDSFTRENIDALIKRLNGHAVTVDGVTYSRHSDRGKQVTEQQAEDLARTIVDVAEDLQDNQQ